MSSAQYYAIIPAAGIGSRMNSKKPKQYLLLNDKAILLHSIETLIADPNIYRVVVVLHPHDVHWQRLNVSHDKLITTIGGDSRSQSVFNGLQALEGIVQDHDWILVHDAVRPCVRAADINLLMTQIGNHHIGGLLGAPVADTLKQIDDAGNVINTVDRHNTWRALTPQMFRYQLLMTAYNHIHSQGLDVSDDAQAIECLGMQPLMVKGSQDNIKITYASDLLLAEKILTGLMEV